MKIVLFAAILALGSTAAFAVPPTSEVGGNVDIDTKTQAQTALAAGGRAVAENIQCGGYEGTKVGGDLKMKCKSKAQTAAALGKGSRATNINGAFGAPKPKN